MRHSLTSMGLAAAFLLAGAAWADDASKMAKADELLKITKADLTYKPLLARSQGLLRGEAARKAPAAGADKAAYDQKVAQILSDQLSWDKLRPQFVKLYADAFTEEELDGILAFYKSPLGQAWLAKSNDVTGAAVKITQQAMQDAQAQIRKLMEEAVPKE